MTQTTKSGNLGSLPKSAFFAKMVSSPPFFGAIIPIAPAKKSKKAAEAGGEPEASPELEHAGGGGSVGAATTVTAPDANAARPVTVEPSESDQRGLSNFQRRTSLKKFASAAEEATMKAEEKVHITLLRN